jgi:uncharacterized protein
MIVVFDTNIYLSAIITEGMCSKILRRARAGDFELISCAVILKELRSILSNKFELSKEDIVIAKGPIIEAITEIIKPTMNIRNICRDPDDDNIIACAMAAKADYLVTGDKDLLVLETYSNIKIINPRDFEALFD